MVPAAVEPAQSINPMSAGNIRIEVGGAVTPGDSNEVRAHLLIDPNHGYASTVVTTLFGGRTCVASVPIP